MKLKQLAMLLGTGKKVSSPDPEKHSQNRKRFDATFGIIETICKKAGAKTTFIEETTGRTLIIQKGKPNAVFIGHIDVVDGNDEQFRPFESDGKLFFRGACDMLGPIAAIVTAFSQGVHDVWLAFSDNEEIGRFPGGIVTFKKTYEAELKEHTRFVFDPDGGYGNIVLGQKGCWWITVNSNGKSAHGSKPQEGINAIRLLIETVDALCIELAGHKRGYSENPERDITISLNIITSEGKVNVVPGSASGLLDMRFWPEHEESIKKALIDKTTDDLEFVTTSKTGAWLMDKNHSAIIGLAKLMGEIGIPIGFELGLGSSDLSLFTEYPQLMIRPKSGNHHAEGEWVDIDSLIKFEELVFKLMNLKHLN